MLSAHARALCQKYAFLARVADQPPAHAYGLQRGVLEHLEGHASGPLLQRRVEGLAKRPHLHGLMLEWEGAGRDVRHLCRAFAGDPAKCLRACRHHMHRMGVPCDYLLRSIPFLGTEIGLSPPTLIPRGDTETWLGLLIERLKGHHHRGGGGGPLCVLDVGTGTGCIAIALAANLCGGPLAIDAVDISRRAVRLAGRNVERNGVQDVVSVTRQDLFAPTFAAPRDDRAPYNLIVSNPPYIRSAAWPRHLAPSVRRWESRRALLGDGCAATRASKGGGVDFHRRLIEIASRHVERLADAPSGRLPRLAMELDGSPDQLARIVDLGAASGMTEYEAISDSSRRSRAVFFY